MVGCCMTAVLVAPPIKVAYLFRCVECSSWAKQPIPTLATQWRGGRCKLRAIECDTIMIECNPGSDNISRHDATRVVNSTGDRNDCLIQRLTASPFSFPPFMYLDFRFVAANHLILSRTLTLVSPFCSFCETN